MFEKEENCKDRITLHRTCTCAIHPRGFRKESGEGMMVPKGKDRIKNEFQAVYQIFCVDYDQAYTGQSNIRT